MRPTGPTHCACAARRAERVLQQQQGGQPAALSSKAASAQNSKAGGALQQVTPVKGGVVGAVVKGGEMDKENAQHAQQQLGGRGLRY